MPNIPGLSPLRPLRCAPAILTISILQTADIDLAQRPQEEYVLRQIKFPSASAIQDDGMPLLGDYLADGLAILGYQPEAFANEIP